MSDTLLSRYTSSGNHFLAECQKLQDIIFNLSWAPWSMILFVTLSCPFGLETGWTFLTEISPNPKNPRCFRGQRDFIEIHLGLLRLLFVETAKGAMDLVCDHVNSARSNPLNDKAVVAFLDDIGEWTQEVQRNACPRTTSGFHPFRETFMNHLCVAQTAARTV